MTAMSSGGRPTGIPNPLSSASERPHADELRQRDESRTSLRHRDEARPRPLDQIFPMQQDDANRSREMESAWRSFCRDRLEAVRGVLGAGRSPPEIAYQLGELLHNHFRTRGVTLTSDELRRLVASSCRCTIRPTSGTRRSRTGAGNVAYTAFATGTGSNRRLLPRRSRRRRKSRRLRLGRAPLRRRPWCRSWRSSASPRSRGPATCRRCLRPPSPTRRSSRRRRRSSRWRRASPRRSSACSRARSTSPRAALPRYAPGLARRLERARR